MLCYCLSLYTSVPFSKTKHSYLKSGIPFFDCIRGILVVFWGEGQHGLGIFMNDASTYFLVISFLFGFILIIIWIMLPFIFMSTNSKLEKLLAVLKENNKLHEETNNELGRIYSTLTKSRHWKTWRWLYNNRANVKGRG